MTYCLFVNPISLLPVEIRHIFDFALFSGKCYNFPENFLKSQGRKPRITPAKKVEASEELVENSIGQRQTKDAKLADNDNQIQNIPAIMPYEAKQALLRKMGRGQRKLDNHKTSQESENPAKENDNKLGDNKQDFSSQENLNKGVKTNHQTGAKQTPEDANVVDVNQPNVKITTSAEHFLYGNMPVLEYQLSDGTGGSIPKTPRK